MTHHVRKSYKQYKKELKQSALFFDTYGFTGGMRFSNVFLACDMRELNIESGLFIFNHKVGK